VGQSWTSPTMCARREATEDSTACVAVGCSVVARLKVRGRSISFHAEPVLLATHLGLAARLRPGGSSALVPNVFLVATRNPLHRKPRERARERALDLPPPLGLAFVLRAADCSEYEANFAGQGARDRAMPDTA